MFSASTLLDVCVLILKGAGWSFAILLVVLIPVSFLKCRHYRKLYEYEPHYRVEALFWCRLLNIQILCLVGLAGYIIF
jgi:hypothetical protein